MKISLYDKDLKFVEKIAMRDIRDFEKFQKGFLFKSKDLLTVVIRSHLYIESLLDSIILNALPVRIKIKTFNQKVELLKALGHTEKIIKKLTRVNNLRNKFAHDLKYKVTKTDAEMLFEGLKKDRTRKTNSAKIVASLSYTIGYLDVTKSIDKIFPFAMAYARNEKKFSEDLGWKGKKLRDFYDTTLFNRILKVMKIDE